MAAVRSDVFGELPKNATGKIQKFVLLAHPSLPGYALTAWMGLVGPSALPREGAGVAILRPPA